MGWAGTTVRGLLDEAVGGGLAAVRARRGTAGHPSWLGQDRREVCRRRSRVSALRRARPRAQAVDPTRVPLGDPRPPSPCLRFDARRVGDDGGDRAVACPLCGVGPKLHGILRRARKAYGLSGNAAAEVEKFPQRHSGEIDVFSPEEIWALVRAAASEQDAAIFLTAAFTGLRMGELLALRSFRPSVRHEPTGGRRARRSAEHGRAATTARRAVYLRIYLPS
jgi:hypothetical protein